MRTDSDGYYKCGTIFSIARSGRERVVYRFKGDPDGANPEAALTPAGGFLYGTTDWGGEADYYGTIFRIFPKPTVRRKGFLKLRNRTLRIACSMVAWMSPVKSKPSNDCALPPH